MTAQDIREKSFEKAVFGGYDMAAVDNFLEEAAADWTAINKENAVLKSKLKVLVEKVEEYRTTEEAMRMALLSAQKMSSEITDEAKQKSDSVINDAQKVADGLISKAKADVANEERKLVDAKRSSVEFIEKMRLVCVKQLDFLDAINDMRYDESAAVPSGEHFAKPTAEPQEESAVEDIDSAVRSIEDSVVKMVDGPPVDIKPQVIDEPEADFAELPDDGQMDLLEDDDSYSLFVEPEDDGPSFNFENLKFDEDK